MLVDISMHVVLYILAVDPVAVLHWYSLSMSDARLLKRPLDVLISCLSVAIHSLPLTLHSDSCDRIDGFAADYKMGIVYVLMDACLT